MSKSCFVCLGKTKENDYEFWQYQPDPKQWLYFHKRCWMELLKSYPGLPEEKAKPAKKGKTTTKRKQRKKVKKKLNPQQTTIF